METVKIDASKIVNGTNNQYFNLLYKRGYLISQEQYYVYQHWNSEKLKDNLFITYDSENEFCFKQNKTCWVAILGTVMDTDAFTMDLGHIVDNLLVKLSVDINLFYNYADCLCGRHIIIFQLDNKVYLIQDATGMRSCFYSTRSMLISSHYGLINDIEHNSEHPFLKEYYSIEKRPWLLPGNITPYNNIYTLIPNHRLSLYDKTVSRFWPRHDHEDLSFNDVADYISNNISNQMITLASQYKLMMQMTRGNDSRISLAASRQVKDSILFYSYDSGYSDSMIDASFAQKMINEKKLNFKLISLNKAMDDNLNSIINCNHYHWYVRRTVEPYLTELPKNRLSIRSNLIEIIRNDPYYYTFPSKITYHDLAKKAYKDISNHPTVDSEFKRYFEEQKYDFLFNYFTSDILYWEYRMGIWMNSGVLLQDDLCFDTWMLFNCRKLLEIGLSSPRYFKENNSIVFELLNRMWPQLLEYIPGTDYKAIDYYIVDSRRMSEIGEVEIKSNCENKDCYLSHGRYNFSFGFATNKIKKGDMVSASINLDITSEGEYCFQVDLLVPCTRDMQDIGYYIVSIGEEKVFQLNLKMFLNIDNQINIRKYYEKPCKEKICFKIVSTTDFNGESGGAILNIRQIHVSKISSKKQHNHIIVTSTYDSFKSKK